MDLLSIISKDLPIAPANLAYSEQLQAVAGTAPYTWTVNSGSLPPGMVLSTAGLLTAGAGAIPANATGIYTFRLRVRDALTTDAFHDYSFEVAPQAYGRVPQFLIDPRFRTLLGNLYLTPVTREKVERHFWRDLIGVTGVSYVHLDRDIQVPDWMTPNNNVSLRSALDDLLTSTLSAIKTVNAIAPDSAGDYTLDAGNGIVLTGQPTGLRIDVVAGAAGGVQEANVEADVSPGASQALVVPALPDVIEVWIRDEFDASWDRIADMSERLTKKVTAPTVIDSWSSACAVGCDATGLVGPYFYTAHYDAAGPAVILNKYDGESMAFIESAPVALPGVIDGEPLVLVNRVAPYEPIVAAIAGSPKDLVYTEFADPDNLAGVTRTATIPANFIDPNALEFEPNEMSGYDPNAKQIHGTVLDMGGGLTEVVLALKMSVAPAGIGSNNCLFLRIPTGVATPAVTSGGNMNATNSDVLDVVFDGSVSPNDVYALIATGRWTGGGGSLYLWKFANAGWSGILGAPLPSPPATWSQTIAVLPTDGMEAPKGMLAMDVSPSGKDAINVVYVYDEFHGAPTLGTPVGPDYHTPSLAFDRYDDVSNIGGPSSQGNITMDQRADAGLDVTIDGRFGRWWSTEESAAVFYTDPKRMPGRMYVSQSLFDSAGLVSSVENSYGHADPTTSLASPAIVRAAHSTYGTVAYTRIARATALFDPTEPAAVLALDAPANPNPFRTYYDGGTNVVFENESPFEWHIKIESLTNEANPPPPNLSVACWQLAQGFQNYFNANAYFPSSPSNPPGPGGIQGTVWDESEAGTTLTTGQLFYPTYYSILPGTWDLDSGSTAAAFYYSTGAPGSATSMWLVFRYVLTPSTILAAEAVIAPVLTSGPLPAPGVYTLAQIAAAMSHPEWVTNYSGAPFDSYQYFCFVDASAAGYYQGWFAQNYIDNAQVYGPGAPGVEPSIPFVEKFTVAGDAVTGVPTEFTLSRAARYAEVFINGIAYWQGDDWEYGATLNKVRYMNYLTPGYTLHQDDRFVVKYLV
jgi:hypothetical protein